ncbi:MAG: NifU family protein [Deltaproteobacteria bacterium]|nr:NifU family protein [Deltaproteobacteria bacterium]
MKFTNKNEFDATQYTIAPESCLHQRKDRVPPVIIDIRDNNDFKVEHLAGANSLPGETLKDKLMLLPPFAKVILYGDEDDNKTAEAIKLLVDNGFSDVCYVPGGINALLKALREDKDEIFLKDIPQDKWPEKIEEILDSKVRSFLASDGGGVKVSKIEGDKLFIRYQGACSGCASSSAGTLHFIETSLRVNLNHPIEVVEA